MKYFVPADHNDLTRTNIDQFSMHRPPITRIIRTLAIFLALSLSSACITTSDTTGSLDPVTDERDDSEAEFKVPAHFEGNIKATWNCGEPLMLRIRDKKQQLKVIFDYGRKTEEIYKIEQRDWATTYKVDVWYMDQTGNWQRAASHGPSEYKERGHRIWRLSYDDGGNSEEPADLDYNDLSLVIEVIR